MSCNSGNEDLKLDVSLEMKNLPKKEDPQSLNAYNELISFIDAKDAFNSQNYKKAFKSFVRLLNEYSPSTFESEALYMLGQTIPVIISEDPSFIIASYKELYEDKKTQGENGDKEGKEDSEFLLENIYSFLGISEKKDGSLAYNGAPLRRIVNDETVTIIPKDKAYYFSVKDRFSKIETEEDKNKFKANIRNLSIFSDMYLTSELQKVILENTDYFPKNLPFELDAKEKENYNAMLKKIKERSDIIKEEINEKAYVNANRVRMRDRVVKNVNEEDKTILYLNNYDTVEVIRRFSVKAPSKKEPEDWIVVRYNTPYGSVVGISYAKYFSSISDIDKNVYETFTNALSAYHQHKYLQAAALFSATLNFGTNYYTDKACYFLWRVNNNIGECVSSRGTDFFEYVKKYPKYFIYDEEVSGFRSSTLLYSYLVKTIPTSPYKYLISSKSDE